MNDVAHTVQQMPVPVPETSGRASPRTNLFLAAILHGPSGSAPVRIRNMSMLGALVEGTIVQPGCVVRLVRGTLAVSARVAWAVDDRCGLRFDSAASVRDWLAPPSNLQQRRVDELVGLVKAGAVPLPRQPAHDAAVGCTTGCATLALARDLAEASRLLTDLAEHLAADAGVVARHTHHLQNFDVALQTIAAVASKLAASHGAGREHG